MVDTWLNRTAAFVTLLTFFSSLALSVEWQIGSEQLFSFASFGETSLFLSVILVIIGSAIFAVGFSWMARVFYSAEPPIAIIGLLVIGILSGFQTFVFCFGLSSSNLDLSSVTNYSEILQGPVIYFFIFLSISLAIEVIFITFYFFKTCAREVENGNSEELRWISSHVGISPLGPQIILWSFIIIVLGLLLEAGTPIQGALRFSLLLLVVEAMVSSLFIKSIFQNDG